MSVTSILNYYKVNDRLQTSGQPRIKDFELIAKTGVSTLINLAMHNSDNALPDEGGIVSSLGMNYIHLPVPFDTVNKDHLVRFCALFSAVEEESVWVHCALNMRASVFVERYFTLEKSFKSDAVVSPTLKKWKSNMEPVWQEIMQIDSLNK